MNIAEHVRKKVKNLYEFIFIIKYKDNSMNIEIFNIKKSNELLFQNTSMLEEDIIPKKQLLNESLISASNSIQNKNKKTKVETNNIFDDSMFI